MRNPSIVARARAERGSGGQAREAPSDDALVGRVLAGDRSAFEALMRRHNARVYRAIRSLLHDEAEVEDAMQQTYLLAFAHLSSFGGEAAFTTWLTRIAVHEALRRLRRPVRLVPVEDPELENDPMRAPRETPEDAAAGAEAARWLERCIDRLPPMQRAVIVLRDVQGLSTAEAAVALEASEEAVRLRLHRARRALRRLLARDASVGAPEVFPFHASRCDRVVAGVLAALSPPSA